MYSWWLSSGFFFTCQMEVEKLWQKSKSCRVREGALSGLNVDILLMWHMWHMKVSKLSQLHPLRMNIGQYSKLKQVSAFINCFIPHVYCIDPIHLKHIIYIVTPRWVWTWLTSGFILVINRHALELWVYQFSLFTIFPIIRTKWQLCTHLWIYSWSVTSSLLSTNNFSSTMRSSWLHYIAASATSRQS